MEQTMMETLRQHALGYYRHKANVILAADGGTVQEFIDSLEIELQTYLDRITALEEGGGGGPSTGVSLDVGTHFNDIYKNCIAFQDVILGKHYLTPLKDNYTDPRNIFNENFFTQDKSQLLNNSVVSGGVQTPLLYLDEVTKYISPITYFNENFNYQDKSLVITNSFVYGGSHGPSLIF